MIAWVHPNGAIQFHDRVRLEHKEIFLHKRPLHLSLGLRVHASILIIVKSDLSPRLKMFLLQVDHVLRLDFINLFKGSFDVLAVYNILFLHLLLLIKDW